MFVTPEMLDAAMAVARNRIGNKDTMRDALIAALQAPGDKSPEAVALERIAHALENLAARAAPTTGDLGGC